jgi:hypothetical protein
VRVCERTQTLLCPGAGACGRVQSALLARVQEQGEGTPASLLCLPARACVGARGTRPHLVQRAPHNGGGMFVLAHKRKHVGPVPEEVHVGHHLAQHLAEVLQGSTVRGGGNEGGGVLGATERWSGSEVPREGEAGRSTDSRASRRTCEGGVRALACWRVVALDARECRAAVKQKSQQGACLVMLVLEGQTLPHYVNHVDET